MTNDEITQLLQNIEIKCNDAIDKLIPLRQASIHGRKYKLGYVIKKLEIIIGACYRGMDKING